MLPQIQCRRQAFRFTHIVKHRVVVTHLLVFVLDRELVAGHFLVRRPDRVRDTFVLELLSCRLVRLIALMEGVFLNEVDHYIQDGQKCVDRTGVMRRETYSCQGRPR